MAMFERAMFLDTIENLCENIHSWAVEWGFWDEGAIKRSVYFCEGDGLPGETREITTITKPWNFGEKIALIHSELSEALEKHRKTLGKGLPDEPDEHCPQHGGIAIELADAVIRIMDLAGKLEIDLGRAILDKMAFNQTRPKKHGKAY